MIRYPDALNDLDRKIRSVSETWIERARLRTNLFAEAKGYSETYSLAGSDVTHNIAPFWGEIKSVYVKLQHNKCIYCEKKLEGSAFASVEWDLEHFRPKGRVRRWPKSGAIYGFPTGDGADSGYYMLAYHPLNYAAACKTCNSPFKSDHFPVQEDRVHARPEPRDYAPERPFLVYPLGTHDEDPADLIAFDGVKAIPRLGQTDDPAKWRRGRVIIDFFGLNRDGLTRERAEWIVVTVWPTFRLAQTNDPVGVKGLERIISERAPFTNCARCFLNVCSRDYAKAQQIIFDCAAILDLMEG